MNWIGLSYMAMATAVSVVSLYLANQQYRQNEILRQVNKKVALRLPVCVGGQSDVCKQADWMPFGEV